MPHDRQTLTLVFNINDLDAFHRDHPQIKELYMTPYDKSAPYSVIGLSSGNELQRSGLINEMLELHERRLMDSEETISMIGKILNLYDPCEFYQFREENDLND